jgi:predicted nuclease of restriction endonuclease-like (RecB) superfamily
MRKAPRKTYREQPKLAALLRELSWSHNLAIMSRCKREEAREFYLRLATRERWSLRELQRQLAGALFERVVLSPAKVSALLAELHPDAAVVSDEKVAPPVRQLPWSHDLLMMSRRKRPEERGFFLKMAQRDRRSKREPGFGVTSVNYDLPALLAQAQEPA